MACVAVRLCSMVGMGCGPFARQARHFLKNNYIYPVTQSPPHRHRSIPKFKPQKPRKKSFSKNAVPAVRYDTRSWGVRPTDERQWCACRAICPGTMRDKAYRRAAGMCATCATREGRKNTTTRSFWHIGWNTTPWKIYGRNPTDTLKWVPNTNIPAFLEQHPDGDHATTSLTHQRRRGSDFIGHLNTVHSTVRCFDWDF